MKKNDSQPSVVGRTLHYYWNELKRHKFLLAIMLISTPLSVFAVGYASPYFMSEIINKISEGSYDPENLWATFLPLLLGSVISVIIGQLIAMRLRIWSLWKLEVRAIYNLAQDSFDALSEQSMSFHDNRFSGSLVSQTNKFVSSFERLVDVVIFDLIPLILSILFTTLILWQTVPLFVVFLLVFIVIYVVIAWVAFKKIGPVNEELASAETRQSGQLADSVSNILTVKSYGRESHEKRRYANVNRATLNGGLKLMRASNLRDTLFSIVVVFIITALTVFLIGGNKWFGISVGTLVLIITYSNHILNSLWDINHVFRNVNRAFGDSREMTIIMDTKRAVYDKPKAKDIDVSSGKIDFNNASFTHSDNKEPIFSGFSLHIKPGQRVGLVGKSGSGKTTLTKLLLRFADVQEGSVMIDDQNIADVTQVSLRENIAYVPQETVLFHRTIKENIAYGKPDASDEEIVEAARLANALEFIETLPKGFETMTGERGVKLSGGQRQRIAIARAILKDAPILILDEATSALDSESEKLIQDALQKLMAGRTSLVIAHRLSTVAELDRIIVLKDGKIVEDGPHKKLIKASGEYASLWNRQSGSFIDVDHE